MEVHQSLIIKKTTIRLTLKYKIILYNRELYTKVEIQYNDIAVYPGKRRASKLTLNDYIHFKKHHILQCTIIWYCFKAAPFIMHESITILPDIN